MSVQAICYKCRKSIDLSNCVMVKSQEHPLGIATHHECVNQNTVSREEIETWAKNRSDDAGRLARAHLELLEWQEGARENAGDLACKVGADPEHMDDAATWHATVQGIKKLLDEKVTLAEQNATLRLLMAEQNEKALGVIDDIVKVEGERDELQSQKAALEKRNSDLDESLTQANREIFNTRDHRAKAYKERDDALNQVAALETQLEVSAANLRTVQAYAEKLESQLAEARKDTERLDWLQVTDGVNFKFSNASRIKHTRFGEGWQTIASSCSESNYLGKIYATIREAIDAAGALRAKPEAVRPDDEA